MRAAMCAATRSSAAFDSRSVPSSGATSRSWKQKKSIEHFSRNSKKASTRRRQLDSESVPSSHGIAAVGMPNGSPRPLRIVCQKHAANRRCSRIGLPSTRASGS